MKLSDLKKQVALIRERTVEKVDYYFKLYVINDKLEEPFDNTFTDELDWYGYWLEVGLDINYTIDNLLHYYKISIKDRSEIPRLLIKYPILSELFDYKIICGKALSSNKHYNANDANEPDVFKDLLKRTISGITPIKLAIKGNESEFLEALHGLLIEKFIGPITIKDFKNHFSGSSEYIPLHWVSSKTVFYVFCKLLDQGFLEHRYRRRLWVNICPHFLDKEGKVIPPSSMSSYKGKMVYGRRYPKKIYEGLFINIKNYASRELNYRLLED